LAQAKTMKKSKGVREAMSSELLSGGSRLIMTNIFYCQK